MPSPRLLSLCLLGVLALAHETQPAHAASTRPPVVWLKGEGNFTKAHRAPQSIDRIVVHVTEGAFWGSVQWLKSPRAHASSHYVISRRGKIVQLVHLSDIAWHAGNWNVNVRSIGIEHEGFTYGGAGFTDAQYHASARLTAWIARRSLMPIDRAHVIGHHEVPGPAGGRGGASHHTDPGPRWSWRRYLALVRGYALGAREKLSVTTRLPPGPLRGVVPWAAPTTGGVRRVEFVVNGRVAWTDRQAPFTFRGRGLNTLRLRNGTHVFELRAYGAGTRHDITRRTVHVANADFRLTTAGARPWTRVRGTVRLRARPAGAPAERVVLAVDGRRVALDRTPPFTFGWNAERVRRGKHVLEVVATAVDGRVARVRIPLVTGPAPVSKRPSPRPRPKPAPPKPAPRLPQPPLAIVSQTPLAGQELTGLVIWRVEAAGRVARVEFVIDGVVRGVDVAAPFTLGWSTTAELPGPHRLTARAVGTDGKSVSATVRVTVPPAPASGGSEGP